MTTGRSFTRLSALQCLTEASSSDIVVAACGLMSRELASLGSRSNHLYVLNAMGATIPIGLGLALGTGRRTWVVEGDGGLLMGLNALATVAFLRPVGLKVVLLDNGAHCSTGGQPTAATGVDLGRGAEGLGICVLRAADRQGLVECLDQAREADSTVLIHVRISPESAPSVPYLQRDPPALTHEFVQWLSAARRGD